MNRSVTSGGLIAGAPIATCTLTANNTRAVPSLIRLSAFNTVSERRGSFLASPATAAASVGESTAPSTPAACGSMPSARAVHDTATAVAMTSATLRNTMMRALARISRKLMFRPSQYRMAGRNSSNTISPSIRTCPNCGTRPSSTPSTMSSTGGPTR